MGDYFGTVVIDTEDTDVYVQSASMSQKHLGQLLIKWKRSYVDCQALASREVLFLHVLTGCDHNSGFYGYGKKVVMDKVINCLESREVLSSCGKELPLQEKVLEDLKTFVLKYIYCSNEKTCGEAMAEEWKKRKKKTTQRLIPDDGTLNHIYERANYLSYCQMHLELSEHPSPLGNGWELVNGKCRPVRYTLSALPEYLINEKEQCDDNGDTSYDDECGVLSSSDSESDE